MKRMAIVALSELHTLDVLQFQLLKDYNNFIAHPNSLLCFLFPTKHFNKQEAKFPTDCL